MGGCLRRCVRVIVQLPTLRLAPFSSLRKKVQTVLPDEVSPSQKSLRILTHNMWCHYPMTLWKQVSGVQNGGDFAYRLACFGEHVRTAGYDVVLLQEVFLFRLGFLGTVANFERCAAEMYRAGLIYRTNPMDSLHSSRWVGQNSGLVIFSRFPFTRCDSMDYMTAEFNNTKGFCSAVINFSGTKIRFVNTHLDSKHTNTMRRQVDFLTREVRELNAQEPCETIITGDFNIAPRTTLASQLSSNMSNELKLAAVPNTQPTHVHESILDYIFLSDSWTVVKSNIVKIVDHKGLFVSDHFGLSVEIVKKDEGKSPT